MIDSIYVSGRRNPMALAVNALRHRVLEQAFLGPELFMRHPKVNAVQVVLALPLPLIGGRQVVWGVTSIPTCHS